MATAQGTSPTSARAAAQRVAVHIVTGFLGSGKTTLINSLLRDPAFAGTLVVVNEFGEVGLDHLLVSSAQDQVVLLDSGCLCCANSGSLRDTLIDLFARRSAGSIPAFDRIVVETSGLADPGPLIATLLGDSALTTRCQLSQVLTLVDGVHGMDTLDHHAEARRQVACADRLLVTKADQAPPSRTEALGAALRALNSPAPLDVRQPSDPAAPLFDVMAPGMAAVGSRSAAQPGWSSRWAWRPQYGPDVADAAPRGRHGKNFSQISAHVFRLQGPVCWATYSQWTRDLVQHMGKRLLRCKGLLALGDGESFGSPWVVQGVQGYFAAPERLAHWPGAPGEGFLVCIGESLARHELAELLQHPVPHSS